MLMLAMPHAHIFNWFQFPKGCLLLPISITCTESQTETQMGPDFYSCGSQTLQQATAFRPVTPQAAAQVSELVRVLTSTDPNLGETLWSINCSKHQFSSLNQHLSQLIRQMTLIGWLTSGNRSTRRELRVTKQQSKQILQGTNRIIVLDVY